MNDEDKVFYDSKPFHPENKEKEKHRKLILKWVNGLRRQGYFIPNWCHMPVSSHADGIGGCWGISSKSVLKQGENYCLECEFHDGKVVK